MLMLLKATLLYITYIFMGGERVKTAQASVILADRNFLGLNLQTPLARAGSRVKRQPGVSDWQAQFWSRWTTPCPSITPCPRVPSPDHFAPRFSKPARSCRSLDLLRFTQHWDLYFLTSSLLQPLKQGCSADVAESCRESSCVFAHLCRAVLCPRCRGCCRRGTTAATGWGRGCSFQAFGASPARARLPAGLPRTEKQTGL